MVKCPARTLCGKHGSHVVKCHHLLSSCLKGGWVHSGSARAKVDGKWIREDYGWKWDPGALLKGVEWQVKLRAEKRRLGYEIFDAKQYRNGGWVVRLVEMQRLVASFVEKERKARSEALGKGSSMPVNAEARLSRVLESFDGG